MLIFKILKNLLHNFQFAAKPNKRKDSFTPKPSMPIGRNRKSDMT